jgi:hypothetical protein
MIVHAHFVKRRLAPWPKPFVNQRSSFETELTEHFPAHVAAQWRGHSVTIAARHYLQVRDENFERAADPAREAQQKAQETPAEHAGSGGTLPEPECESAAENKVEVAPSQLCASAVGERGWAILDSNQ